MSSHWWAHGNDSLSHWNLPNRLLLGIFLKKGESALFYERKGLELYRLLSSTSWGPQQGEPLVLRELNLMGSWSVWLVCYVPCSHGDLKVGCIKGFFFFFQQLVCPVWEMVNERRQGLHEVALEIHWWGKGERPFPKEPGFHPPRRETWKEKKGRRGAAMLTSQ